MSNGLKKILNPNDLEYLTIDQAASICSVSEERFEKWIEKGVLPVIEASESRLIRSRDLIQHLIRHNIRIPERLLQGNSKKILFILLEKNLPSAMTEALIWTLYRLRQHPAFIVDFIECGSTTELKVITFAPDVIFLLKSDADTEASVRKLNQMLAKEIPIHHFPVDQAIDLDNLLNA